MFRTVTLPLPALAAPAQFLNASTALATHVALTTLIHHACVGAMEP